MGQADAEPTMEEEKKEPGGELMVFDDGSMTADKAQSSAMSLVINYADPSLAAGTAVLGLGLVVLPLLSKLNKLQSDEMFQYKSHGETNPKQPLRLFTESELRQRLGTLDADAVAKEIVMSTEELDEHMEACSMDQTDDEVGRIQKWRDSVNANLRSLQKRSALAFLGLPPDSSMNDINAVYKKMALELHPDKGGDPEKFQELQEMKERLTEIEKEEGEGDGKKEDVDDPEEEEAKKQKEKEEEEEKNRLPPNERVKKLRMDVHDNTVRLWEKAKKSRDEIIGEKALKANAQPALNILRLFVERFVANEIKTLRHDDTRGAEAKLRKFLKQGAEILCVAALADVQATLSTLAMHFNYRLVARSGSPEIQSKCAALLEAVGEVPQTVEQFLQRLEADLADQKDRDKRRKEQRAAAQKAREAKGDFSGDAGAPAAPKAAPKAEAPKDGPTGATGGPTAATASGYPPKNDPFADFDFGATPQTKGSTSKTSAATPPKTEALAKKEEEKSTIQAAVKQKRTGWDPSFDHPYAGALKSNGTGIYCRPCQRWIVTYELALWAVERSVRAARDSGKRGRHHLPLPLGWLTFPRRCLPTMKGWAVTFGLAAVVHQAAASDAAPQLPQVPKVFNAGPDGMPQLPDMEHLLRDFQDVKQHLDSDANSLEQQLQQVEAQGFNGIAQQKAWDDQKLQDQEKENQALVHGNSHLAKEIITARQQNAKMKKELEHKEKLMTFRHGQVKALEQQLVSSEKFFQHVVDSTSFAEGAFASTLSSMEDADEAALEEDAVSFLEVSRKRKRSPNAKKSLRTPLLEPAEPSAFVLEATHQMANLTQETGESSDIEGQSITLLTEDLLKLRQAEVQGRSLLKKSFQQSFEAGKKRQEALRKQESVLTQELKQTQTAGKQLKAKIAKVQKALDQMQQNLRKGGSLFGQLQKAAVAPVSP